MKSLRENTAMRSARMLAISVSVGLLAACSNTTEIQRRYVDMRDDCRTIAERWVDKAQRSGGRPPAPVGNTTQEAQQFEQKDINAQLATVFSDCMFEKGWTVATPPREKTPTDGEAIEARQRAEASKVSPSDGIGIGPGLEPGKNMPNFRRLKYR